MPGSDSQDVKESKMPSPASGSPLLSLDQTGSMASPQKNRDACNPGRVRAVKVTGQKKLGDLQVTSGQPLFLIPVGVTSQAQ